MTATPAVLFGPLQIPAAAAALYTVPVNVLVTVNRVVVTNVTAGAVSVTLWVVRNGGTNTNADILVGASAAGQSIPAGPSEPYIVNSMASLVLAAGDAIWGEASAATSLNAVGSGWTN